MNEQAGELWESGGEQDADVDAAGGKDICSDGKQLPKGLKETTTGEMRPSRDRVESLARMLLTMKKVERQGPRN